MADAHRESERKGVSSFKAPEEQMEQLVVTINPAMGGIVKVEKIDKAGNHQELTEQECGKLVGEDEVEEIQDALDEAFEAAVVSVIGEGDQADAWGIRWGSIRQRDKLRPARQIWCQSAVLWIDAVPGLPGSPKD